MSDLVAPCPLCGARFDDDAGYVGHLADEHGLVDDEGTETTLEHALVVSGLAADKLLADEAAASAAASKSDVAGAAAPTLHPSRIYDPDHDDHRFKPMVIGLAGVLLLAAVGVGAVLTSGGSGTNRTAEVAVTSVDGGPGAADKSGGSVVIGPDGQPVLAADPAAAAPAPADAAAPTADPAPETAASPSPPTAPPPTAPADPPPAAPDATAAPPTTLPFVAPTATGARIDGCVRDGRDGMWTFSYLLSGGSGWAPAAGATAMGDGRYREQRTAKASDGFPATTIAVVDTATGQARSVALSPSLAGQPCR